MRPQVTSLENGDFLLQRCISLRTLSLHCRWHVLACCMSLPAAEPDDSHASQGPRQGSLLIQIPQGMPLTPSSYLDGTSIYYCYYCLSGDRRSGMSARPPGDHHPATQKRIAVLVLSIPNTTRSPWPHPLRLGRQSGAKQEMRRPTSRSHPRSSAVKSYSGPIDQRQAHRERTDYHPKPSNSCTLLTTVPLHR